MRREQRKKLKTDSNTFIYVVGGILVLAIIAFILSFVIYSNKLSSTEKLDTQFLAQMNNDISENTTSVSTNMGKTVEESKNEIDKNENTKEDSENKKETNTVNTSKQEEKKDKASNKTEETEPKFESPIESSDISREFAKENLVYSETLKEWITHLGIDIKAEKATVVKTAEAGTVKSIKNDPRYGLTVIIEHSKGYTTVYANLLTTEFVSEGEKVEKGQTIGTVGDTAVYEVVDDSHLHFEIIKDSENVNPLDYIKF